MLTQRHINNQNLLETKADKKSSILHSVIETLKRQKETLERENKQLEKKNRQDNLKYKMEIEGLKKKVSELSEENLVNDYLVKETNLSRKQKDDDGKEKQLQIQVEHYRSIIKDKEKMIQNMRKDYEELDKRVKQAVLQKEKNMQMSLMEKITLEDKMELMEKQIVSKKKIIEGMKSEIQRVNKLEMTVSQKEKKVVVRGREMERYQKQIESYYLQHQAKSKKKIQNLEQQNQFLRKQFKKISKKIRSSCECEGQAEEWKQRLFKMGKELAKTRVQLGKFSFKEERAQALKKSPKSQDSLGSLTLSEESDEEVRVRK